MFTSFSTALTGLNAMTDAIDVVGNNLANLNTTGYKDNRVSFQELISESIAGSADTQVGLGTARPITMRQFTQGAIQTTSGQYDAAIQGQGFFVVKDSDNATLYTRAGNFQVDGDGYLVTTGRERVQGWLQNNGVVNTNGALNDIQVPIGQALQPKATQNISLDGNLDASSSSVLPLSVTGSTSGAVTITAGSNDALSLNINEAGAQTFTLNPADTTIAAVAADLQSQFTAAGIGATATVNSSTGGLTIASTTGGATSAVQVLTPASSSANATLGMTQTPTTNSAAGSLSTTITAVDSLGNTVPLTITFTKYTQYGQWNYSVSSPQGTVTGGAGAVLFNSSGQLVSPSFANGSSAVSVSGLPDGAQPLNLTWSLYNTDGTPRLTQYSGASGVSNNSQDGRMAAQLTSVSLANDGKVLAKYSDGTQQVAAQLALANFRNPQSLLGVSDNNYTLGADTSAATIGTATTGGRGAIEGGALESSTVDIASEFSNLLVYQRSYQANSRVVTVSDELTQETVGLIK
jgi:flagellar hook protein FlgE